MAQSSASEFRIILLGSLACVVLLTLDLSEAQQTTRAPNPKHPLATITPESRVSRYDIGPLELRRACKDPLHDGRPGVIKRDPCGRWYCGDAKLKSLLDVQPNYSAENNCTWQRMSWRCACIGGSSPARKP
jgi:hypothetical protein